MSYKARDLKELMFRAQYLWFKYVIVKEENLLNILAFKGFFFLDFWYLMSNI